MAVLNGPVVASLWELAGIVHVGKPAVPDVRLMTVGSPREGDGDWETAADWPVGQLPSLQCAWRSPFWWEPFRVGLGGSFPPLYVSSYFVTLAS